VKRATSLYLDQALVEEAKREAQARGVSLSAVVEEALRLYLAVKKAAAGGPPAVARPAHSVVEAAAPAALAGNQWVAVLRRRGG